MVIMGAAYFSFGTASGRHFIYFVINSKSERDTWNRQVTTDCLQKRNYGVITIYLGSVTIYTKAFLLLLMCYNKCKHRVKRTSCP